jgi:hypothetical protein
MGIRLLSRYWKEPRKQIHLDRFTNFFIIKIAFSTPFTGRSGKTDHSQQKTGNSY